MSTKAVIMRTVSFPFILFARYESCCDISNDRERPRRDLVHRILRRVVWRIRKVDDVDHAKPGVQQWDVIIGYQSAAFLNEHVSVAEIGGRLPHSGDYLGRLLERIHLIRNAEIFIADHIPQNSV